MKTILSMGAGVNSTALLLTWKEPLDYCLFADTGSEKPETYRYLEKHVMPFCQAQGIEYVTVRRATNWPLHEYYERKKAVPFRKQRETTVMWKLRPLYKWIREVPKEAIVLIGIDFGEVGRMRDSRVSYVTNRYPLIEWKFDRSMCEQVIRQHGWPLPVKSGCWCCPFQNLEGWQWLKVNHPDLFERSIRLEEDARLVRGPKAQFHPSGPLVQLTKRFNDKSLDNFQEELCGSNCFT